MTDKEFERWARCYGDTVFRVACHALRNQSDAEDVTETVFLKLYERKESFESEEHGKAWLIRVAVNESRRLLSAPWKKRTIPLEDWDGPDEKNEESGVLHEVMALEPKYRLSIYLYYYEGYSVREVAQIMRTRESTVQTWLQRGREKLRGALAEEGGKTCVRPEFLS